MSNVIEVILFVLVLSCDLFAGWNSPLSGIPVNQSMMAHSHMAFAVSILLLAGFKIYRTR